jgi:DNA-directed RNA polymerase sigma subunit (sigma70/sigma32)
MRDDERVVIEFYYGVRSGLTMATTTKQLSEMTGLKGARLDQLRKAALSRFRLANFRDELQAYLGGPPISPSDIARWEAKKGTYWE